MSAKGLEQATPEPRGPTKTRTGLVVKKGEMDINRECGDKLTASSHNRLTSQPFCHIKQFPARRDGMRMQNPADICDRLHIGRVRYENSGYRIFERSGRRFALEHIPEKWVHFSDKDMLQLIEAARILITRVIQPEWNTR
jgi:hypothetical protein